MILKDQRIYLGEREFTTDLSALTMDAGVEPQDNTSFLDNTRIAEAGLLTFGWNLTGFWAAAAEDVDDVLFQKLGVNGVPVSVAVGGAAGDRAFFLDAIESEYRFLGEVGTSHKFTVGGQARGRLVRGQLLHRASVNSNGNGSAVNVGAVAAGQRVYAALHVYVDSGTTLDVIVQSDDGSGFATPTTRLTFAQATGKTSQVVSLAGPVTDTWWRTNHTVVGGAFSYAVILGIH